MANKNIGAYERFQEGVAKFGPAGMGFLAGVAIEGPKWLADEAQEKLALAKQRLSHEDKAPTAIGSVVPLTAVRRVGNSAVEHQRAA
ncbi:MAG: hypothetical protein AAB462_02135 [Patescibacteria group bacterium]